MFNQLTFQFPLLASGAKAIVPAIDGVTLIQRVTAFEARHGYDDPAGGYGGIIPEHMNYGPIDDYFLVRGVSLCRQNDGAQYMLGCQCGEVGCWPLMANIRPTATGYEWSGFHNSCRGMRDYSGFGPFMFERSAYEQALHILRREFP